MGRVAAETDGFAEFVRGLKERSGLSYGVLAKKLHTSTSTLHRYCNGDAVPAEFAPVERLGRLCGATRPELIELHRLWILADEARRRRASLPTSDAADAASNAAEDAASGASGAVEAVGSQVAGVDVAAEAEAEVEVEAETVVVGPGEPDEAVRARSRKRLRVVLAAAAVVALAVPVAYGIGRSVTGDDGAGRNAAGPSDLRGGSVASSGGPSAAGSPPATTSTSPSATAPRSASASATASGTASGTPVAPTRVSAADAPLSVGISSYNWAGPCGQHYLIGRPPEQVPPPPPPQDSRRWATALGGVDGGHMNLELTATGRTDAAVVINALHVRVVERAEPLAGNAYFMGDGCGGGITPQTFDIDLDEPAPYARPVAGLDGERRVPAKDFPYKVSTTDPQVLNLDVHTESHVAAWYLELDWSSGGQHGTIRVDDGGKPFRTTAVDGRKTYDYRHDPGQWATG
ncbi:helix-turn-helix domain-containing protein [Streptomyces sp. NPDC014870]|uniref:helix-turn-helix domain-containing protein n=1 Tax=Streptomyces sp. NPDC014870 TaxID=3364925 RepID=UPI0037031991